MLILHTKRTALHNVGESFGEGPYRTTEFHETVADEEIEAMLPFVEHHIKRVHSASHLRKMKGACRSKNFLAEVKLAPESFDAMMAAAALALMAVDQQAFAVTRPPGHHATKHIAQGFCFFNNVAVATDSLLERGERVCIIDIDAHHGNGTESIFRHEERVLFCSVHQAWRNFYPQTGLEGPESWKKDAHILNYPLRSRAGDEGLIQALDAFSPRIQAFNPDRIAVSVGVDGYREDRIANLHFSLDSFRQAGRYCTSFGVPLFAVLEGGYHAAVRECVEQFVSGVGE